MNETISLGSNGPLRARDTVRSFEMFADLFACPIVGTRLLPSLHGRCAHALIGAYIADYCGISTYFSSTPLRAAGIASGCQHVYIAYQSTATPCQSAKRT